MAENILSPQGRKRSNSTQDDVATVEKFQFTEDFDHVDKISIKAKRRSRGRRDLASLAMTFRQEDYASITLIADGAGTYLAGSTLPRTDPQTIWPSSHKKAVESASKRWAEYDKWKKSKKIDAEELQNVFS